MPLTRPSMWVGSVGTRWMFLTGGALLGREAGSLDYEVFDDRHTVPFGKKIPVGIADDGSIFLGIRQT